MHIMQYKNIKKKILNADSGHAISINLVKIIQLNYNNILLTL